MFALRVVLICCQVGALPHQAQVRFAATSRVPLCPRERQGGTPVGGWRRRWPAISRPSFPAAVAREPRPAHRLPPGPRHAACRKGQEGGRAASSGRACAAAGASGTRRPESRKPQASPVARRGRQSGRSGGRCQVGGLWMPCSTPLCGICGICGTVGDVATVTETRAPTGRLHLHRRCWCQLDRVASCNAHRARRHRALQSLPPRVPGHRLRPPGHGAVPELPLQVVQRHSSQHGQDLEGQRFPGPGPSRPQPAHGRPRPPPPRLALPRRTTPLCFLCLFFIGVPIYLSACL
jgi:hypothetical protein